MQSTKKPSQNNTNNRDIVTQSFLLSQPIYDTTPPIPTSYPKGFHYSLDPSRYYAHKYSSFFLANTKPLLIGCDVGIPVQQLILFSDQFNNTQGILHPDDQMLIREILPQSMEKEQNKQKPNGQSSI